MSFYTQRRKPGPVVFDKNAENKKKNTNIRTEAHKVLLLSATDRIFNNTENDDYSFLIPFDANCNLRRTFYNFTNTEYYANEKGVLYISTCIDFEWVKEENPLNIPYRVKFSVLVNDIPVRNFIIGVDGNLNISVQTAITIARKDCIKFKIDRQRRTGLCLKKNALIHLDHFLIY